MKKCPVCNSKLVDIDISFQIKSSAISSESGLDFNLSECQECLIYQNTKFESSKISYKNKKEKTYFLHTEQDNEIKFIIKKIFNLIEKDKINYFEFGCGDGSFLDKIVENHSHKMTDNILAYDLDVSNHKYITSDLSYVKEKLMNFLV